ncbi:MAG: nickel pincer cofactor biosynthesis protein LarC [Cenarchaeum sp. SB0663_bin_5]|nr:nickel pincer cofactor biosynthesis protein LarC [Cenarchaeum sp. SB0663_bin_5]MYH03688.1 nickel pincer cofactor biosynthesis protein LarC [Cenarchaeum sp. SB0675_bin_21]
MVLVIDPRQAGISGDMMLSALVDMRGDGDALCKNIQKCAKYLEGSTINSIHFQKTARNGMACTQLKLNITDPHFRPASEIISAIEKSVEYLKLSKPAKMFAERTVHALVSAESQIHGTTLDSTELHELSSVDTLVDIVGVALALDGINAFQNNVIIMPVNVGGGTVKFAHGTMYNPAPSILNILSNAQIPIFGGPEGTETTTPTGAAIVAGLAGTTMPFYPHIVPKYIGYGAGSKDVTNFANVLLLVQGDDYTETSYDTISVIETNVDDISGEVIGDLISTLLNHGALDATIHTRIGKKGRPVHVISVMCAHILVSNITDVLVRYTGTLGVRLTTAHRYTVPRQDATITVTIDQAEYTFRYKSHKHRQTSDFKIEFDDIADAAKKTGMNARTVERLVRRHIEENR